MHRVLPCCIVRLKLILLLLLAIACTQRARATFQGHYGGSGDDAARGGVQALDDGFITVGESRSFSAGGDYDVYVVRTNTSGAVLWAATYDVGNGGDDFGRKIRRTADGGFVIVGSTEMKGCCAGAGSDAFVLSIASDGSVRWARRYGGSLDDQGTNIKPYGANEYAVTGYTASFGEDGKYDAFLMVIASDGTIVWARTYGGSGFDAFHSVVETEDNGDLIAVGESASFGQGDQIFVVRVHSDGHLVWAGTAGGSLDDAGYDIVHFSRSVTGDDIYAVVGATMLIAGHPFPYLIKFNGTGGCICDRIFFNAPLGDMVPDGTFREAIIADDKSIVVAGYFSARFGFGGHDAVLMRIGWDCQPVWSFLYGAAQEDEAFALDAAQSGYILAGYTKSFTFGNEDLYLVRTNGDGTSCIDSAMFLGLAGFGYCFDFWSVATPRWQSDCAIKMERKPVDGGQTICSDDVNDQLVPDVLRKELGALDR
ncbi:MAG: hypothetical protein JST22_19360 [Bacteroidetes bacterium]|nr:hypothetical protein [Bacteroidota bacterium]